MTIATSRAALSGPRRPPLRRPGRRPGRARPGLRALTLLACALSTVCLASLASLASAADYHAFLCAIPPGDTGEGSPAPTDDMSYSTSGTFVQAGAGGCGSGGAMRAQMIGTTTHPYGDGATATFTAPNGLTVAGFKVWRYEEDGPTQPYGAPASNLLYTGIASVEGMCAQSLGCSSRGTSSPWYAAVNEVSVNGLSGVGLIQWSAGCGGGPGGTCPASGTSYSSLYEVFSLDVLMNDPTGPSVSEMTGAILAGGTFSGAQSISFKASDPGSGVYSEWLVVDGKVVSGPTIIDTNSGACKDMGATKDGLRSFDHPQPCLPTASGLLTLETASLKDGSHTVSLYVDDAAGNQTIAKTWSFVSDNAPTVISSPAISGSATVGSTLTGTGGSFSAPPGAGSLGATSTAWLRCSDAAATHCSTIATATGSTYEPSSADVGYYIVYQNTASDNDGSTSSDSQPTIAVSEPLAKPTGSGGGSGSGGSGSSTGSTSSGSSSSSTMAGTAGSGGAGGTGGAAGAGGAGGGASTITLNLSSPLLAGSTSPWQLTLVIAPRTVRRGTTITLSGLVWTSPRPQTGKLVYLRARGVRVAWRRKGHTRRRVRVYSKWFTFLALRTGPDGRFKGHYRFRLGGHHLYQFMAVAPQEGGFLDTTGTSKVVMVTERR